MMSLLMIVSAIYILMRCIAAAAKMKRENWSGHPLRFLGLSAAYALVGGGALAFALGIHFMGGSLLMFGSLAFMVFDRRISEWRH